MAPSKSVGSVQERTHPRRTAKLLPFQDKHYEPVCRLYQEVFGAPWARDFQARWTWSQQKSLYPQATPKWVLADGERVVGFLSTMPLLYWIGGRTVCAHTPCDYMVHPEYRFHGIRLMQEFFNSCENCVTCDDMPATIKVTRWLGAKQVGTMVRHVKLLDARALAPRRTLISEPPLRWPVNLALGSINKIHSTRLESGFTIQPADGFDRRFAEFSHQLARSAPVMVARDLRFLEWRYGDASPHREREIAVATDHRNRLMGYVIWHLSRNPSRTGHILDLQTWPPQAAGLMQDLLNHAAVKLQARGAWSIRYHHLCSPYSLPPAVLRRCGFVPRGGHQFMVKFRESGLASVAENQQNWNFSYGDSEASHAST